MIYFDYAATTPMSENAISAYVEAARLCLGNESSLHDEGSKSKSVVKASRSIIANAFHIDEQCIIFTSGGTESNHLGIRTLLKNTDPKKKHIISSSIEHSSINDELKQLETEGYQVEYLNHLEDGTICLNHLQHLINDSTALLIIQHVNSEIGIIQPLEQAQKLISQKDVLFHVDCVQSFGKIDCCFITKIADSISISSHKVYGPKGVGATIFPRIHNLTPIHPIATHENGYRAGTLNVPGIYSFAISVKHIMASLIDHYEKALLLRELIKNQLYLNHTDLQFVEGRLNQQLPHIICILCPKVQGQYVMMELNQLGYAISSGSACQSGTKAPSKVLLAIGKNNDEAKSSIRISLGRHNTKEQCLGLIQDLSKIINRIT